MVSIRHPDTGPGRGGPGGPAGTGSSARRGALASPRPGDTPSGEPGPRLVACPECALPAEVTDWFVLGSTEGAVDHVVVSCLDGHYFRMSLDGLPTATQRQLQHDHAAEDGRYSRMTADGALSGPGFSRLPGRLGIVGIPADDELD